MKFVDEVEVTVQAGDGGRGCVSFLREKHRRHGGPDGGDGGDGGNVVFLVDGSLTTLFDFKLQTHLRAARGRHGQGKSCDGARGADLVVRVPAGTVVTRCETHETLADMTVPGARVIVARGGRGGRGNRHFATPTHRAPRSAEPGQPGEHFRLHLELRVLADVGLVGMPNAGKSTLLAALSAARPRVAPYPFTTLAPHLGVVQHGEESRVVMADIPGLIEGAHQGTGLGTRFLRHLSRTSLLVHLIDPSTDDRGGAERSFDAVNAELTSYDPALAAKPQVVVATKLDLTESRERLPALREILGERNITLHAVSALTREGLEELVLVLCNMMAQLRRQHPDHATGEATWDRKGR
jgi:GTP-binding protein